MTRQRSLGTDAEHPLRDLRRSDHESRPLTQIADNLV